MSGSVRGVALDNLSDGHRHSNREPQHYPATSSLSEPSKPPIGPPSGD
jgi:hypothetical protein